MLNSKDIPYVREDRLHNEMKFLSEKRNYLQSRMRDSRGPKREGIESKLLELETQVCYVFRELEQRYKRKESHTKYLKQKNMNKYRGNRDNRANHSRSML